jgi:hypothetical protein
MAGVAGPMLRRDRFGAVRMLAGLLAGSVAAGVLLALPTYLLGTLMHEALPERVRLVLLAAVCGVLGLADLTARTPHVWRQVPQRLMDVLPPGSLGTAWGFDLGLLFTTQKTTSLIWVALASLVLLAPAASGPLLAGVAALAALVVVGASIRYQPFADSTGERARRWFRQARRASGVVILMLFLVTAARAAIG